MKAVSRLLCGLALAALPCTSALADQFTFSFGGPNDPIYGYGILTATPDGTDAHGGPLYLVTGITGYTAGQAIANNGAPLDPGTFPVGIFFGPGNDNLLSDPASFSADGSPAYFDNKGLSYELANGAYINIAGSDNQTKGFNIETWYGDQTIPTKFSDEPISVSPVPEPASLALFGSGLLGLVGIAKRRFVS